MNSPLRLCASAPLCPRAKTQTALATLGLMLFLSATAFSDDVGEKPVVLVNGEPITLREVEDEMLSKEGAEKIEELVHAELEHMKWNALKDTDTLVSMANWRLSRGSLVAQMLGEQAGPIRRALMQYKVIDQALKKAGVSIDEQAIKAEIARMEAKLQKDIEKQGHSDVKVDLATYIQQKEKISLEEYTKQQGFRMLAGLHQLVEKQARAEIDDEELRAFLADHYQKYRTSEAVDLAIIYIPFPTDTPLTSSVRQKHMQLMTDLYNEIVNKKKTFAKTWEWLASSYDSAGPGGSIGWVLKSGKREIPGRRTIPKEVIEQAFASKEPFPVLLPPIETEDGGEIVEVRGHRKSQEPDLAVLRERILADCVADQLEMRTRSLSKKLYDDAEMEYVSMPDLIRERQSQVASMKASPEGAQGEQAVAQTTSLAPAWWISGAAVMLLLIVLRIGRKSA
jgi:hypothetical protein